MQLVKSFSAMTIATVITTLGYNIYDFTPTSKFSFWLGLLVDFLIWMTVYLICEFTIRAVAKIMGK